MWFQYMAFPWFLITVLFLGLLYIAFKPAEPLQLSRLSPVFIPLLQKFGLNPVMISVAFIAAGNSFFLAYQQPFIMISDSLTKSRGWTGNQVATAGALYAIAIIVGIVVSTFYWKAMGLMP
jgi:hypothetical protein